MAFTWVLSEIRSKFRDLTKRSSTSEISDTNVDNWINEYYTNHFPEEANVFDFQTDFTQDLTPTDAGEYALAQTVVAIEEPVTLDGGRISLWTDKEAFFATYPESESAITPPALVMGTTNTAAVANAAFKYAIGNYSYAAAATETALSGDAVPANTYGAWTLEIDADGTISVTEADGNATGYASPGRALAALAAERTSNAVMGYVTVLHTSTFTPGTTALNAGGITATFTDGKPGLRACPEAALVEGNTLYVRPRSNDWHRLEAQLSLQRPSALSGDSSAPLDIKWGPLLAVGAALLFLAEKESDVETMGELLSLKQALLRSVGRKQLFQWTRDQRAVQPAY